MAVVSYAKMEHEFEKLFQEGPHHAMSNNWNSSAWIPNNGNHDWPLIFDGQLQDNASWEHHQSSLFDECIFIPSTSWRWEDQKVCTPQWESTNKASYQVTTNKNDWHLIYIHSRYSKECQKLSGSLCNVKDAKDPEQWEEGVSWFWVWYVLVKEW